MDNHTHTTEEYLVIACRQYAESHKDQFMPRATLWQAADTIERLQKERDQLGAGGKVWQRTAGHLKQERDAALAEVERLKTALSVTAAERDNARTSLEATGHAWMGNVRA